MYTIFSVYTNPVVYLFSLLMSYMYTSSLFSFPQYVSYYIRLVEVLVSRFRIVANDRLSRT